MAPRGRAAMASDDPNRSYPESSPDPLNASINEPKARGRQRKSTARASTQPLVSSSPSKHNRRSSVTELDIASPSKSMVLNTPRTSNASPWRIRVTVEAEPGSDDENMESPTVKHVTRTKTTTVPLKDPDAPSPVKRRGRPRKSDAATSAKAKRSGTPVRKRANSKPRTSSKPRSSSVGADASAADVDTDVAPKKRRGRPRKSIQPPPEAEEDIGGMISAAAPKRGRAAKATKDPEPEPEPEPEAVLEVEENIQDGMVTPEPTPPIAIPNIQTTFATPQEPQADAIDDPLLNGACLMLPMDKQRLETLKEYEAPIVFTPPETELSKRLRARKGTPAAKRKVVLEISSDEESEDESAITTPSVTDEEEARTADVPANEPVKVVVMEPDAQEFEPIQMPSVADDDDEEDELQDATNFAFDEGATRMPDDPTILESENFSMVSVDSLPSSGGLTSPAGPSGRTPQNLATAMHKGHLKIPLADIRQMRSGPQATAKSSPGPSRVTPPMSQVKSSPPVAPPRYKTPSIEPRSPTNPPPIEPMQIDTFNAQTPRLGQVVKAGVALQGVVEPSEIAPQPGSSKSPTDEQRARLDDLFRGFSERTRRELQAGLRLGEQLAQQNQSIGPSSPALSSPIKTNSSARSGDDVFAPQRKQRQSRLLTPEDQDDYAIPPPPPAVQHEVRYPSLSVSDQESHLISPARSPHREEDEMSWKVDTPPMVTAEGRRFMTVMNERGEMIRGREISVLADNDGQHEKEDYDDIWHEEASRSSSLEGEDSPGPKSPQVQDLFAQEGPIKPPRGKLPKTWRRKSSGDFQYSDEAEEPQELTPSSSSSDEPPAPKVDKGKGKAIEPVIEEYSDGDDLSEASDDTGMFFQSNLPSLFNKKRSVELRRKKAEKLDLSLLMNEGESLLPESSPPVPKSQTPIITKPNPFLNTPPRFQAYVSSPVRSSPLRQVVRASDSSSELIQQVPDESTLPLPPSSPFHTQVEGDTVLSTASDQRQLLEEMAGATDSSFQRIRNEADNYLDAYEAQERTLHEIDEVTEPSRTLNKETTMMASSPPAFKQTFEESMLNPKRTYAPLFDGETTSKSFTQSSPLKKTKTPEPVPKEPIQKEPVHKEPAAVPIIARAPYLESEQPAQPSSGIFGRLTSTLWSALGSPPPPPLHPVLAKFDQLPKIEPWTKTHYKALDALFQMHKKTPTFFSPSRTSNTTNTNNALLAHFLRTSKRPFVGAQYSVWGYSMEMTEPLVVLCAVYAQLLTLKDVFEYEEKSGRTIEMGDCNAGVSGETITQEEVVRRLASVVMGEDLRRDEKIGMSITRKGGMRVVWPS